MPKNQLLCVLLIFVLFAVFDPHATTQTVDTMAYSGTPYLDSVSAFSIQTIPGKLKCAFYDRGGEGVAYHDCDRRNSGSGDLNKGPGYLNTFRMNEAVDISYTKYHDSIDNSIVVDTTDSTSLVDIPTTFDARDPVAWKQWHHWNYVDSVTVMHLEKGKRVITLEISKLGNVNHPLSREGPEGFEDVFLL